MEILKMIEKRAELWESAKNFLASHTDESGKISDEDAKSYDKMEREISALSKNIERFQKQAAMDAQLNEPMREAILNNPAEKTGKKKFSAEYNKAFMSAIRNKFQNVSNIMQEGVDGQGGYLVPDEWDERLIDVLTEENVIRKLGTNIATSGERKINLVASKPAAVWVDEGQQLTFGDATFKQKTLDAHKIHVGVRVTNELLFDNAYNLESYLVGQFTKTIADAEEDAFINGNGITRPTGILTTAASDSDTMILKTAGNNLTADDVINLVYSLKRPYRKNASFVMNDATLSAVRKFKDTAQGYIWQPSLQAGEPDRLLGYPIYTSAFMPTISAGSKIIMFGDFSYYNIGDRGTRSFRQLSEKYADTDETAFLMLERVDGILTLNESIKVLQMKG